MSNPIFNIVKTYNKETSNSHTNMSHKLRYRHNKNRYALIPNRNGFLKTSLLAISHLISSSRLVSIPPVSLPPASIPPARILPATSLSVSNKIQSNLTNWMRI